MFFSRHFNKSETDAAQIKELLRSNVSLSIRVFLHELLHSKAFVNFFKIVKSTHTKDRNFPHSNLNEFQLFIKKRFIHEGVKKWDNTFLIKRGNLYKNRNTEFGDVIHDRLYIPYQPSCRSEDKTLLCLNGVSFRIIVINGFLKLQVGEYFDRVTPLVFRRNISSGFVAAYQKWDTLTEFPLIYFLEHEIPLKFFNKILKTWRSKLFLKKEKKRKFLLSLRNQMKK